jgi:hypothetical protein
MTTQTQNSSTMQTRIQELLREKEEFLAKKKKIEAELEVARRELAEGETESVIVGRTVDTKLTKRVSALSDQLDGLNEKNTLWARAITALQDREVEEKGEHEYQKLEAFRKKAAPQLKRLTAALFEVRNSTQAFFDLLAEPDAPQILDMTEFLLPRGTYNPANPFEGMTLRMAKMAVLNGAMNWVGEDLNHGRRGPQYPDGEAR